MPKLQNPPQAGEKRLCQTLFLTMLLSVISAVGIIYSIVIVYAPAYRELKATLEHKPKMCTTLVKEGNLTSAEKCLGWTSCEEWCLSKSDLACHHVYAAVRDLGTTVYWDGCDFFEDSFINQTCNILEDVPAWNCKQFTYEQDKDGNPGNKESCVQLDGDLIYCESGICKNISRVYACEYKSKLEDIEQANGGRGECNCAMCDEEQLAKRNLTTTKFSGECDPMVQFCYGGNEEGWNETVSATCSRTGCHTCKDICRQNKLCFDMSSRKDPTEIGTDEFKNSVLRYYECKGGYCSEIYDLKCERRCNERTFKTKGINSVLFIQEKVIMAKCAKRSTVGISSLDEGKNTRSNTLMVACTNVTTDLEAGSMTSKDCVNGTWFEDNFNNGQTNYSHLTQAYWAVRDDAQRRVRGIHYEQDIVIYPKTQLRINIEGCVNNLNMDCMKFYHRYARDGRNYTARAVYPCYYDATKPDFVVINFDPDDTLILLIFFVSIPCGVMVLSCSYMCTCSKFIHVADDGHMRLRCCGKYVTGIGNVPRWDPPPRKLLKEQDPDVET